MLHVHRVLRLEELDCLRSAWNQLLDPSDPYSIFLRHEWVCNWFAAFGADSTPRVLVAADGTGPCGVLPLRARHDRFAGLPLRRLDLMANGHSPRADLIAAPGRGDAVRAALAHHLLEIALDWDVAVLPELLTDSELALLGDAFPPSLRLVQPQRRAPTLPLGGTWDAYRSSLSRNFQRTLRNNRNRVGRAGAAEVEVLADPDGLAAALPDMFAIGDRSWQGEAGSAVGSTEPNRRFYTGLVRALGPLGVVRLWFLRIAGRRVAFELHLVHAGVEFGLKTGYDREFETLGPGRYLDQMIVEQLFATPDLDAYDLLGDADAYKLRWTQAAHPYVRLTLFGTRAPARLLSMWNLRLLPVLRQARNLGRRGRGGAAAAAATTIEEN